MKFQSTKTSRTRSRAKRVCVVQPILSNYSLPVFMELSEHCEIDLLYSAAPPQSGFGQVSLPDGPNIRSFPVAAFKPLGNRLGIFHRGLLRHIFRQRPDVLLLSANMRNLSFWGAVLCGRFFGIPVYAHGHGPFRKKGIGVAYRGAMQTLLRLVTSYICYAPAVRQSFIDYGFDDKKLTVAHNSVVNAFPVRPEEKKGNEKGILFIGRLRQGSNLQLLLRVVAKMRENDNLPIFLHVIGAGEEAAGLREKVRDCPWVELHGEVYDANKIREVSLDCFLGCYPGDAGLSVVHMMSLSLPVVTHNDLHAHGPEPSFIRDGVSGVLYDHADPEQSLYRVLRSLASDQERLARMQRDAFADYQSLSHPSLAARLWAIIGGNENPQPAAVSGEMPGAAELSSHAHTEIGHLS
jgi:glycosyltransferase involved in cell wall biosynthesis